jgi:hypothetical protein
MQNVFKVQKGKMLFWRLGGINSVKQSHFGKSGNQPPTSRGIWCFPYPFHDLFFVFHKWEEALPKRYRRTIGGNEDLGTSEMTDDEASAFWSERERLLKEVRKRIRPSTFWYGGEFYSHINVHGKVITDWFLWDSVSECIENSVYI